MALTFDESVKQSAPAKHQIFFSNFEEITRVMNEQSGDHKFVWDPPNDSTLLLNHYLDIIWSVHVCKFSELCHALVDAINHKEFIVYGLIGRSLIEHAAIMRYYCKHRIKPTVDEAVKTGSVSGDQIKNIINELDRFLRGSKFNWDAFLAGRFDELFGEKEDSSTQTQVNVLTCVQKWARETPPVLVLYDLFCDLVHPNIGSTLLIMKKWEEGVGFGGQNGEAFGEDIVIRTLAGLVSLFKDIRSYLNMMLLLQIREEK